MVIFVARVKPPAEFSDRPYLQPIYDRPEFIVRNLIRLHGGWWDGYASNLMPASEREQAREIASLAGGVDSLIARARELGTLLKKTKGDPRKLNAKERSRVRNLVVKGATGRKRQ